MVMCVCLCVAVDIGRGTVAKGREGDGQRKRKKLFGGSHVYTEEASALALDCAMCDQPVKGLATFPLSERIE